MGRRTKGNKGRYIEHAGITTSHHKKGQIIDNVSIGSGLSQDRRKKARNEVSSGYGHRGDQKRKKR